MHRGHTWCEEQGGNDRAVGVVDEEEDGEKLVPEGEAGAENGGGGGFGRDWLDAGRKRREDV